MIFPFIPESEMAIVRDKLTNMFGASAPVFTIDDRALLLWLAMSMADLRSDTDANRETRIGQEILDRTTHLEGENATLREQVERARGDTSAAQLELSSEASKRLDASSRVEALKPLLAVALEFVSKFGSGVEPNTQLIAAALDAKKNLEAIDEIQF